MEKKYHSGDKAPDFELFDHNEKAFRLSDFKGKRVVLSFHPLAWTSVCAKQMKSLEENYDEFKKLNTVAVGINISIVSAAGDFVPEISCSFEIVGESNL